MIAAAAGSQTRLPAQAEARALLAKQQVLETELSKGGPTDITTVSSFPRTCASAAAIPRARTTVKPYDVPARFATLAGVFSARGYQV